MVKKHANNVMLLVQHVMEMDQVIVLHVIQEFYIKDFAKVHAQKEHSYQDHLVQIVIKIVMNVQEQQKTNVHHVVEIKY